MLNHKIKIAALCATLIMPASFASAQIQRMPGVADKPFKEVIVPPSHSLDAKQGKPLEDAPQRMSVDDAAKELTTLNAVQFEGSTVIKEQDLQAIAAKYIGQKLTKGKLAELKYEIKKAYYDAGYILVHVVTKPQDISAGVLKVSVYEAEVGNIEVQANNQVHSWLPEQIAKRTKSGNILQEVELESMINDINDLYGAGASLTLRPGEKFKTTDLVVNMRDEDEDHHYVGVNNYGSDLTGRTVAYGHVEHSNLLKMGEKFAVDLQHSDEDLWTAAFSAIVPTGLRNINLETSYLHSENDIVGRLKTLNASGETDILDIGFASKVMNTRKHRAVVKVGFQDRRHESFLANVTDTKDNLDKIYGETSYLYRGLSSVFYSAVKLSRGIDAFGSSEKGEANATRLLGDQEAWIFEPSLIFQARPFTPDGTIKTSARAQVSSNTLLSSDLFAIGGYGSVRGFDVAEEAAEAGYVFSLEYNHVLPLNIPKTTVEFGPFFDGGAVDNRVQGSVQDTHFYSVGLGAEISADLVPTGETVLRLDWAHPIGSYNSTTISDDTFYFNLTQRF